jgi:peptidyl-tRNA hydrolase
MRKMYIAVLDDAPDYMVPTLVAHSAINAHRYFEGSPEYDDWLLNSFKKVVVRVGRKEFDKIASRYQCWKGHENTICEAQPSCLVVLPMTPHEVPPLLTFAKLWKPKDYPID